jgi:hypothetical protein
MACSEPSANPLIPFFLNNPNITLRPLGAFYGDLASGALLGALSDTSTRCSIPRSRSRGGGSKSRGRANNHSINGRAVLRRSTVGEQPH